MSVKIKVKNASKFSRCWMIGRRKVSQFRFGDKRYIQFKSVVTAFRD
jgi:hypothetical protein